MYSPRSSVARALSQMFLTVLLAISTQSAMAQSSSGSIATMFANASSTWVAFINLARGMSFLAGFFLTGAGLIKLKDVGDGRTPLKAPIWMMIIGAALFSMPASIDMMTQTMSLGSNTGTQLLSQAGSSSIPGIGDALTGVLLFVKLIGHLAFFRGLLILKDYGSDKQGASLGRGLTHLFGGAAAININATTALIASTFFTGMSLPGGLGG